jgi:hypothetical protein
MRGPYRRYTAHQIEQLFDYVIEQGKTAKDVARLTGVNVMTARHFMKKVRYASVVDSEIELAFFCFCFSRSKISCYII